MLKIFQTQILLLDRSLFLVSVILFFIGLVCSIAVVKKNIRFFLIYPLWIWRKLSYFLKRQPSFIQLFILIFFFNSLSLFINIISGIVVILPYFFSFLIGLNVGIIGYHEGGWRTLFGMFLTPHVIFELPAAWFSTTLGMQIGREILINSSKASSIAQQSLLFYVQLIIPLLFLAGLIEAALIKFMMNSLEHTASFPEKPFDA